LLSAAMPAQLSLGGMYYNGQGVRQDYTEAAKWTRKAAEQGYTPAQADLGVLYWNGQGVQQDVVLAYMWLSWRPYASRMRWGNVTWLLPK
jgi:uncharacterized protein